MLQRIVEDIIKENEEKNLQEEAGDRAKDKVKRNLTIYSVVWLSFIGMMVFLSNYSENTKRLVINILGFIMIFLILLIVGWMIYFISREIIVDYYKNIREKEYLKIKEEINKGKY